MEGEKGSPGRESLTQLPLKRKSDPVPAEEDEEKKATKKQKPDAPVDELGDAGRDEINGGADQNASADEEKGKPVMPAEDKGKRKRVVEGEEDEENSGVEDKDGASSDDDDVEKFLSDDSLTLMEVDNILPQRTRPRESLKLLSPVRMGKNADDDDGDRDYCVDEEEEEDEEDEETETEDEKDDEEKKVKEEVEDNEDDKEQDDEEEEEEEEEEAK